MIGTLKKIFAFAGGRKNLLKKSLFFSLLNGIFASFQFGALYFIVDALASDDHSFTSVWMSLGMMALSIAGRIFASFFSMNEQTIVGYGMVADKRISIGDRLRYMVFSLLYCLLWYSTVWKARVARSLCCKCWLLPLILPILWMIHRLWTKKGRTSR